MPSQLRLPHLQNGYSNGNLEDHCKHYMRWCAQMPFTVTCTLLVGNEYHLEKTKRWLRHCMCGGYKKKITVYKLRNMAEITKVCITSTSR